MKNIKIIGVKIEDRTGDESDFVVFRLSDVNYISVYKPRKSADPLPVYHTIHGSYAPLLTLKDISVALEQHGFDYLDKSTIVNKNRIKHTERTSDGVFLVTFIDNTEIQAAWRSRFR